jgi:hypothetical protein
VDTQVLTKNRLDSLDHCWTKESDSAWIWINFFYLLNSSSFLTRRQEIQITSTFSQKYSLKAMKKKLHNTFKKKKLLKKKQKV